MKRLSLLFVLCTVVVGVAATYIDTKNMRAGDLFIPLDKGVVCVDDAQIERHSRWFKAFEPGSVPE